MKSYVQNLTMLSAVIAFGCNSNKSKPHVEEPQSQTASAEETSDDSAAAKGVSTTIEGTVKSTNHGKDGFTAEIETKDNGLYHATISRVNLNDPKQYRDFNSNEIVRLTGDSWKMGDENQLTVREIN